MDKKQPETKVEEKVDSNNRYKISSLPPVDEMFRKAGEIQRGRSKRRKQSARRIPFLKVLRST